MVQFLLGLLLFTLSWSALKFGVWAPLPVVILMSAALTVLIRKLWEFTLTELVHIKVQKFDYLILLAFLLMLLNVIFIPKANGINYLLAYFVVFGSYLVLMWSSPNSIQIDSLLKANYFGINFICTFVIIEVIGRSTLGVNFFEWIPRSREATATVTLGLYRGYGLATEPTQLGNYFCCFFPFAVYYANLRLSRYFRMYLFFLTFAALLTFSAAMFVVAGTSVLLYLMVSNSKAEFFKTIVLISSMFLASGLALIEFYDLNEVIFGAYETLAGKISLSGDGTSTGQRMELFNRGLNDVINHPFLGTGLGSAASVGLGSNINWYLFLAAEGGLLVLFLYVGWFSSHLVHAFICYKNTSKQIYLMSLMSIYGGVAYLVFLSTFQNLYLLTSILLYRLILKSGYSFRSSEIVK